MTISSGAVSSVVDALIDFRTTWLRAVAMTWSNNDFRRRLTDPIEYPEDVLEYTFGDFKWKWRGIIRLEVKAVDDFRWIGDDWTWPTSEKGKEELVLHVPISPPVQARDPDSTQSIEPGQLRTQGALRAAALADYYRARPSLFGPNTPDMNGARVTVSSSDRVVQQFISTLNPGVAGSQLLPTVGGDLAPDPMGFVDFEIALMSVMAKCWEHPDFRRLVGNPSNLRLVMQYVRGYVPPWKLSIRLEDDTQARWVYEDGTRTSYWELDSFAPHRLVLALPAAPKRFSDWSVALAAYNATGAQYPFTCCNESD